MGADAVSSAQLFGNKLSPLPSVPRRTEALRFLLFEEGAVHRVARRPTGDSGACVDQALAQRLLVLPRGLEGRGLGDKAPGLCRCREDAGVYAVGLAGAQGDGDRALREERRAGLPALLGEVLGHSEVVLCRHKYARQHIARGRCHLQHQPPCLAEGRRAAAVKHKDRHVAGREPRAALLAAARGEHLVGKGAGDLLHRHRLAARGPVDGSHRGEMVVRGAVGRRARGDADEAPDERGLAGASGAEHVALQDGAAARVGLALLPPALAQTEQLRGVSPVPEVQDVRQGGPGLLHCHVCPLGEEPLEGEGPAAPGLGEDAVPLRQCPRVEGSRAEDELQLVGRKSTVPVLVARLEAAAEELPGRVSELDHLVRRGGKADRVEDLVLECEVVVVAVAAEDGPRGLYPSPLDEERVQIDKARDGEAVVADSGRHLVRDDLLDAVELGGRQRRLPAVDLECVELRVAEDAVPVGVAEREDPPERLGARGAELVAVGVEERRRRVHHRLDRVVEDVPDKLQLLRAALEAHLDLLELGHQRGDGLLEGVLLLLRREVLPRTDEHNGD
mmetsp:Transcript_8852/g.21373  ORF Transcript_8852/g.21373 Transcript_8852/m.21373 type:complete len:561 (+) Transcript_8852:192-1874(+)